MTQLETMGAAAKQAARVLMNAGAKKDAALLEIAKALRDNAQTIIEGGGTDRLSARPPQARREPHFRHG